jgi:Skp family chaperone for outer membrane proteins
MGKQREAFEAKNAELAKLQEDYMAQQRTMNSAALPAMERTIQEKETELRRFREDAQADFNDRQNQVLQRLSSKIQVIIQEYAQNNSFDAIFMRDQNQIYVAPALDVTEAIIEIYNQQYPGTPAPAPSAASNQ